ncbi:MAG: phosphate signaling complex protein PhoU [Kangiellaceae bacterium]|jgi:phosphate transport system protein|nr:phosphate signaling complex protein PhoU [Kangiellaceae bacterium]
MEKSQFTQHISRQFNEDLENIRQQVMTMGGIVEEQIDNALKSIQHLDPDLAKAVVEKDDQVNMFEVKIDQECARILAKRQPAAGDLRLVIAIIKTITDLERVGDEAAKIARMSNHISLAMTNSVIDRTQINAVLSLAQHVQTMFSEALDAFARHDVQAAIAVAKKEDIADQEYKSIIKQLKDYMSDSPSTVETALDVMWSARAFERIGDHTRNICEYVIYLVEGKDVRHLSLEDMEKLAQIKR